MISQCAVIVDYNTELKSGLINKEMGREIRNSIHISIHITLKTYILSVTIKIQVNYSNVDWRITGLQIVKTRESRKRVFTETQIRKS